MSIAVVMDPERIVFVINESERLTMCKTFTKSWFSHPLSWIVIFCIGLMITTFPILALILFFLNPYGPMYFSSIWAFAFQPYGLTTLVFLATVETIMFWIHVVMVFVVGQACMMGVMCLNVWLQEIKSRIYIVTGSPVRRKIQLIKITSWLLDSGQNSKWLGDSISYLKTKGIRWVNMNLRMTLGNVLRIFMEPPVQAFELTNLVLAFAVLIVGLILAGIGFYLEKQSREYTHAITARRSNNNKIPGQGRLCKLTISMKNLDLGCRFHPGGQLIEDFRPGGRISQKCGLIMDGRDIDVGSESQTVGTGQVPGDPEPPSRLGEAEDPLSTGSDLSTTIAQDSTNKLNKVPKKGSSASVDRVLGNAFKRLPTIADRVHLSKNVVDRAKQILTDLHEKQILKYRSKEAIATASLYWACRQENNPRTFNEICEATQESKKEIRRCCKLILNILNIGINPITVEDFMPRFCTSLELPPEIQNAATEIARNAVNMHLVLGRSPISVTAAAIYMASKASSIQKTKKEIADVARVAVATLGQVYKLMERRAEELLPRNFDFSSH
ncbi:unnamed protein product [Allacma fusca]|uniref:Cyclin-like domain-containing protein n=1 Tax=Allacma fusca TaxID=39272 RepID=A0A8J2L938_9HEXA|nr:unnamed protein product [Allacma fusca]